MGGYGSNRWWSHSCKNTVERCCSIESGRLARGGMLPGYLYGLQWLDDHSKEATRSICYRWERLESGLVLRLIYRVKLGEEWLDVEEPIQIERTTPNYGGARYWFLCPLIVDGISCYRRVRKLYLPPRSRYFGCRHCHRLTYHSAQTHDSRFDVFKKNPEILRGLEERLLQARSDPKFIRNAGFFLKAYTTALGGMMRKKG